MPGTHRERVDHPGDVAARIAVLEAAGAHHAHLLHLIALALGAVDEGVEDREVAAADLASLWGGLPAAYEKELLRDYTNVEDKEVVQ